MEPRRGLLIEAATVGRFSLPPDSYVWILAPHPDHWEVEYRDERASVPRRALLECPIPRPSLADLRRLDACFGLSGSAFEIEHRDQQKYFAIERCREHGRLFLRDTRGSVACYDRLTLLRPEDADDWEAAWSRHHKMSDDWLNFSGRTL